MNLKEIQKGDIFSEHRLYRYERPNTFTSLPDGKTVTLSSEYVEFFLNTSDQYEKEVIVGLEDKYWTAIQLKKEGNTTNAVGDLKVKGIRTVWKEIGTQVFTVFFYKQSKNISDKEYNSLLEAKAKEFAEELERVKTSKKGVKNAAIDLLKVALTNPVVKEVKGELRKLRGVKTQWETLTGHYDVLDLDIDKDNKRQVNINTIQCIVVDNTKYIVEK